MRTRFTRRQALTAGAAAVAALAGCIDGSDGVEETQPPPASSGPTQTESTTVEGIDLPLREADVPLVDDLSAFADASQSGGVPKDGIPSIDDPKFESASAGDERLDPADPVFGLRLDGETRAYPQEILVRHEIVNDTVGDRNVAVTYCPLTGTTLGFERGSVEFGVSGNLVNSNLVMYDRETDSRWPQILGTAVSGELNGYALSEIPLVWTTWERWRETYPETEILSEDTDRAFDYGRDPYGAYNPAEGYYARDSTLFETMHSDDSYHQKAVFLGARSVDGALAVEKDRLREDQLLRATVGETPYVVVYDHDLDAGYVYRNPDDVTVTADGEQYVGPDGERSHPASLPLEQVHAFDAMWFAWYAFYPDPEVLD